MATAPDLWSPEGQEYIRRLLASPLYTSGEEGEDIDPQVREDSLIAASAGLPGVEAFLRDSGQIPGGISGNGVGGGFGGGGAGSNTPDISTAPAETQEVVSQLMDAFKMFQEGATKYQDQSEMALAQGQGRPLNEFLWDSLDDYLKAQEGASGGNRNLADPKTAPADDQAIMQAIVDSFTTLNDVMLEATEKNRPFTEVLTEKLPELEEKAEAKGNKLDAAYLAAQAGASGGNKNRGLMDDYYDAQRAAAGLPPVEPYDPNYKPDRSQDLMAGWDDYKQRMLGSGMSIGEVYRAAGLPEPDPRIDNTAGGQGAGILPGKPTTPPDPAIDPEGYEEWMDSPLGRRLRASQDAAPGGAAENPIPVSSPYRGRPEGMNDYIKTTIGSGAPGVSQEYRDAEQWLRDNGFIDENGNFIGGEGTGDLTWTPPDYPFWDDIQTGQQTLFDILSGTADIPYLADLLADLELDIALREQGLEQSLVGRGIAGSSLGESERNILDTRSRGDRARTRLGGLMSFLPVASQFYGGMNTQGLGQRNQSLNEFTTLAGTDEALKTGAANRLNQAMGSLWTGLGYTGAAPSIPNVNIPNTSSFGQNLGGFLTNLVMGAAQNPNFNPWSQWSNFWDNMGGSGGGGSGGGWSSPSGTIPPM